MKESELIEARRANYWKSSNQSPEAMIEELGGRVIAHSKLSASEDESACYLFAFQLEQHYSITWPILPHDAKDALAASRQACTFIYHEVKACCMRSKIIGTKRGFAQYQLVGKSGQNVQDYLGRNEGPLLLGE